MRLRYPLVKLFYILLVIVVLPTLIFAITWYLIVAPRKNVSAWISVGGNETGAKSLRQNHERLDTVSPMWYQVDADGRLAITPPGPSRKIKRSAGRYGVKLTPTISNNFDPKRTALLLHSRDKQDRLIAQIVDLVGRENYQGVDLDFENMTAAERGVYPKFVARLRSKLSPLGGTVSVDVHPKLSEPGPWPGVQAHDYRALATAADEIRVMAYDQHYGGGPPGPVASAAWTRRVVRFALTKIPANKLVLGIPLYGYDWSGPGDGEAVTFKQAAARARHFKARVRWDKRAASPWFTFELAGRRHFVWFENRASTAAKIEIPEAKKIKGFAFFRLGDEDGKFWRRLPSKRFIE